MNEMTDYRVATHCIDINPPFEELPWCAFFCPLDTEDVADYFAGECGWLDDQGYYAEGVSEADAVYQLFKKQKLKKEAICKDKKDRMEIYYKNHKDKQ